MFSAHAKRVPSAAISRELKAAPIPALNNRFAAALAVETT
jgi:hypothetical protein